MVLTKVMGTLNGARHVRDLQLIPAKIPILRMKFTVPFEDIVVDLNANNSVSIRNTHLLCYYSSCMFIRFSSLGFFSFTVCIEGEPISNSGFPSRFSIKETSRKNKRNEAHFAFAVCTFCFMNSEEQFRLVFCMFSV